MRIKHHRQRFSAALRVPEHTALAVRFGGNFGFFDCFPHCEILMISRQNLELLLPIAREQDKVFQDVQQPLFLEYSLIEGVKLRVGGVLIIALLRFPLHETVKPGSNRTCFVGGQVADHADGVIIEHGGNVLHIVPNLIVGVFSAHFILGRAFQFHQNQRHSVDKQDNIRAAVVPVFHEGILIHHIEIVLCCICIVNQPHHRRPFFSIDRILDRDAILQIIHKDHVFLQQASSIKIIQFQNRFVNCRHREIPVQPYQTIPQNIIQQWAAVIRPVHIGSIDMGVAHVLE